MTFQQLQFVTTCAATGSISAAAQQLFTSTSNISKAISSLETEIGFPIFIRAVNGIIPTQEGKKFIKHAHILMCEYNSLTNMYVNGNTPTFSCSCPPMPYCSYSFSELCKLYQNSESMNFTLFEGSFNECCERVILRKSSIAIIIIPKFNELYCNKFLKENNLNAVPIKTLKYYIKFRKGHPLSSSNNSCDSLDLSKLSDYPLIDYNCDPSNNLNQLYTNLNYNGIQSKKTLHINSMERKIYCLKNTDAFSLSLGTSPNRVIEQDLVCIPLDNNYANLYYVHCKDSVVDDISKEFISLLQKELMRVED